MRRHVVGPFRGMSKHRIAVGDLPRHKRLEVRHDTRIGVFAEHQRGTGVPNKDMAQPGADTGISNRALHFAAEVIRSPTLGPDFEILLSNQGR